MAIRLFWMEISVFEMEICLGCSQVIPSWMIFLFYGDSLVIFEGGNLNYIIFSEFFVDYYWSRPL